MGVTGVFLRLRGVGRDFGSGVVTSALRLVDLDIVSGEFVALTGTSGSGKSTLLNILGLLDSPTVGSYSIAGEDVAQLSERHRDWLRQNTFGFVFQDAHVLAYETVVQNVVLGLEIRGDSRTVQATAATSALAAVGLRHRADALGRDLSGGERQRLAIARALATSPRVLLADEPTGNLDAANTDAIMTLLRTINRNGATVIVVTHDNRVAETADRRIMMTDGQLHGTLTHPPTDRMTAGHPPTGLRVTGQPSTSEDIAGRVQVRGDDRVAWFAHRAALLGRKQRWWAARRTGARVAARAEGRGEHRYPRVSGLSGLVTSAVNALTSRPARTLALIASFVLGTGGLVAAAGIGTTASQQIADRLAAGALDEVTVQEPAGTTPVVREDRAGELRELSHVIGVGLRIDIEHQTAQVSRFPQGSVSDQPQFDGPTIGTDAEYLRLTGIRVLPSTAVNLFDDSTSGDIAIVGATAARTLGIPENSQGHQIWVAARAFTVVGVITDTERQPVFANAVIIPTRTLPALAAEWFVKTEQGYPADIADAVPYALNPANPGAVSVNTVADLRNLRRGVAGDLSTLIAVTATVLLAMAILSSGTAMYLNIQSRISEIALRRALGASRLATAGIFLAEGTLLGLAGGLAGTAVGTLAVSLTAILQGWTPIADPTMITIGLVTGLLGGSISAILPALQAAKIQPAQAIR
ncbi:MAG: hypothetical protein B5766_09480 [Candidatus Lumbricidophila eiseniae]|uniref:ABC transporter domain-containing protein n=1 Tax=Candidatus Lumbricidiphila eiseniae TaxID=1969409 RepID=A0A2A6FQB7_9MICO|nr:MAG: hypothetical protein B5766_09480 [Candidatus Lumbricidophila eiseniae]